MTYWDGKGKYQKEADEINKLRGKCDNYYLELYHIARNAYYDIYNNGGCNANRFEELFEYVSNCFCFDASFTEQQWTKLFYFLYIAKNDNRDFYLFRWNHGKPSTQQMKEWLILFEEFMDWVIIQTYNNINSQVSVFEKWWNENYAGKLGSVQELENSYRKVALAAWNAGLSSNN